jgi:hypothetical protein
LNDSTIQPPPKPIISGPPSGYFVVLPSAGQDEPVSFGAVLRAIRAAWVPILASTLIAAAGAAVISLFLPTIYRAKVIVAPVVQGDSSIGGSLRGALSGGGLGGLASLAGIDLGSGDARKEDAYATLISLSFAREFIEKESILPVLFADRWDPVAKRWRPGKKPPTLDAGVRKLMSRYRYISVDRKTGMVTLTMDWYTPEIAAAWANRTIELLNDRLREEAVAQAKLSIDYLYKELEQTNVVGVQQGIDQLIQQQISNSMLANVQREYSYRFIDRAVPPDVRASPQRVLITALGALGGLVVSLVFVLVRNALRDARQ